MNNAALKKRNIRNVGLKPLTYFYAVKATLSKIGGFLWKFKYIAVATGFVVWMVFFDKQNYFYRSKLDREMETLVKDTLFYDKEIREASKSLEEINGDKKALEKLGREKYLMKKDDEDVFVIVNEAEKEENTKK